MNRIFKRQMIAAAFAVFAASGPATAETFKTLPDLPPPQAWAKVDLAEWQPRTSKQMMGLFERLFAGYAEFDGAKNMTITVNETPAGTAYEVFITQTGYADDSVSGV